MVFDELLNLAEELNTDVFFNKSIIGKSYVIEIKNDSYCINLDMNRIHSQHDLNVCLAHELGHVQSGTLYYNNSQNCIKEVRNIELIIVLRSY